MAGELMDNYMDEWHILMGYIITNSNGELMDA